MTFKLILIRLTTESPHLDPLDCGSAVGRLPAPLPSRMTGSSSSTTLGLAKQYPGRPLMLIYLYWEPLDAEHEATSEGPGASKNYRGRVLRVAFTCTDHRNPFLRNTTDCRTRSSARLRKPVRDPGGRGAGLGGTRLAARPR